MATMVRDLSLSCPECGEPMYATGATSTSEGDRVVSTFNAMHDFLGEEMIDPIDQKGYSDLDAVRVVVVLLCPSDHRFAWVADTKTHEDEDGNVISQGSFRLFAVEEMGEDDAG